MSKTETAMERMARLKAERLSSAQPSDNKPAAKKIEPKKPAVEAGAVQKQTRNERNSNTGHQWIALDQIDVKKQVRTEFDPEKLQELADSIKEHGLLAAINVVKEGNRFVLEAGERRYRAHQLLRKTDPDFGFIKALVRNDGLSKERQLIENIQREALSPVEEGNGILEVMKENGYNQSAAAKALGKTVEYISRRVTLVTHASEETQAAVNAGDKALRSDEVQAEIKAAREKARAEKGKAPRKERSRIDKVPLNKDTVIDVCKLLKKLANEKNAAPVVFDENSTFKDLKSIIELRINEFL